ncbi:UDP-glucosyltransferase 2-like [Zerene cesonia]|uniref:UDP-glucosyltransferase 2-like n=1 Tax=Zerene cesonia TaxID=33412 RepID=UPI0018E595EB|nr:UDP-glucosyltransferase 2-like [Zerene cesonia]
MRALLCITCLVLTTNLCRSAKILGVFPVPVYSHQQVFRTLIEELARRGHEVTVITPFPTASESVGNITQISIEDSIEDIRFNALKQELKDAEDIVTQQKATFRVVHEMFDILLSRDLKEFLRSGQKFDLIIVEACVRLNLIFSHIFKAPLIQISSFGAVTDTFEMMGGPTHPLLYPLAIREKFKNLSYIDKVNEIAQHYGVARAFHDSEKPEDDLIKKHLGADFPTLKELKQNVAMVFLNVNPIWDSNRPVPPNVVYLGGLHLRKEKPLPKDLKAKLDSASNGVIYMSFGSTISSSMFNMEKLNIFLRVVSKLPYTILWKWDADVENVPDNVVVGKWFPQRDLLKHPSIKLFITQGGLQSTDEAIDAAVPLVGVPILWDQWMNVDKIAELGIGVMCSIHDVTEESFRAAIDTVLRDKRYKENIENLRNVIRDQPQTPLERAVWWSEYVIRHNGAKYLRSPAFDMPVQEYYEIKLILSIILVCALVLGIICKLCIKLISIFKRKTKLE